MSIHLISTFDIETGPRDIAALMKKFPFNPDEVALGNLKDPAKIEEKIAQARGEYGNRLAKRACLKPEVGTIQAIGITLYTGERVVLDGFADERLALQNAWDVLGSVRARGLAGWNIFKFDLPWMIRRSIYLGVRVPEWAYDPSRPFAAFVRHFVDLMKVAACGGGSSFADMLSLHDFAVACGFDGKSDANCDGARFWQFWQSPDATQRAFAMEYLTGDMTQTALVGDRLVTAFPHAFSLNAQDAVGQAMADAAEAEEEAEQPDEVLA